MNHPQQFRDDTQKEPSNLVAQAVAILKRYGDKFHARKNTLFNALAESAGVTDAQPGSPVQRTHGRRRCCDGGVKVTYRGLDGQA